LVDPLELENRRKIYEYVSRFPGSYFREIQKAIGLEVGTLEYHLDYLERRGILSSEVEAGRRRYYVSAQIPHEDKHIIGLMRQKVLRRIVVHLLLNPRSSFSELLSLVGISKSTLSFHLSKLVKAGVVKEERVGREKVYWIDDVDRISGVLITYKSSLLDDVVDRFVEVWMEIGR